MKKEKLPRVLIVDDDDTFRHVMASELSRRGYTVSTAGDGRQALDQAQESQPDVTLLDLTLPDMDGIEVIERLGKSDYQGGVVVLTGHGTIDTAVQATRLGANDYLEKPCPMEKLEVSIRKTHEHVRLVKRQRVLEDGYTARDVGVDLIGESSAFSKLLATVARVARTGATTLIQGETGVGKEVVATLLHGQSPRSDGAFVVVDCAALHEQLLQSELFGHERGAFTGAARQKHGLFEVANGGTLFLDEIGDTSQETQSKLLRVLETGRFRRLGGTSEIAVDVRLISATNRDLSKATGRGHFRSDLYFRLATFTIDIPPLRERGQDVQLLVEHFAERFNQRFALKRRFGAESLAALLAYRWPGNVRELIHVVEQTVVLAEQDLIGVADLPAAIGGIRPSSADEIESQDELLPLREIERRHVLRVVEHVGRNRARAAKLLQISERNLYRLLQKYERSAEDDDKPDTPSTERTS